MSSVFQWVQLVAVILILTQSFLPLASVLLSSLFVYSIIQFGYDSVFLFPLLMLSNSFFQYPLSAISLRSEVVDVKNIALNRVLWGVFCILYSLVLVLVYLNYSNINFTLPKLLLDYPVTSFFGMLSVEIEPNVITAYSYFMFGVFFVFQLFTRLSATIFFISFITVFFDGIQWGNIYFIYLISFFMVLMCFEKHMPKSSVRWDYAITDVYSQAYNSKDNGLVLTYSVLFYMLGISLYFFTLYYLG